MKHETPTADSGAVTLLRLQLAAAENRAQERLMQMQSLEEQLHAAKEARMRDAEELARQISELEQQVHGNLAIEGQRTEQIAVLEEMLREAQVAQALRVGEAEATWLAEGAAPSRDALAQAVGLGSGDAAGSVGNAGDSAGGAR